MWRKASSKLRRYREHLIARTMLPPAEPVKQVIIGIGAQKSGTTWLATALAAHPDIYVRKKEIHYWDTVRSPYVYWDDVGRRLNLRDKSAGSPFGNNPLDHSKYLPSLDYGRRGESIVCEVTPAYALSTQATFADMKAIHRDVRFVFLIRDPVERLWSGLRHKVRSILHENSSEEWLEQMFYAACDDVYDPDLRRSQYDKTLQALDDAGCNVCTLFYEKLFTEESMLALERFADLDQLPAQFDKRVNVGAGSKLKLSESARQYGRKALGETYEFIADRFGDTVPKKWRV